MYIPRPSYEGSSTTEKIMAQSGKVRLLGTEECPFVLRARIALNIRSVEYEFVKVTLQPKSKLLLQSNPVYNKIPVLIHGDRKPICESLIIVQYVDDAWSSGLPMILPSDPHDRAIARFWATYVDDKWYPAMKSLIKGAQEKDKKGLIKEIAEGMKALKSALKPNPYFGGKQIGYLDIAFGSFLGWLRVIETSIGMNLLDTDLSGWAATFRENPAVKRVMPELKDLIAFDKKGQSGLLFK